MEESSHWTCCTSKLLQLHYLHFAVNSSFTHFQSKIASKPELRFSDWNVWQQTRLKWKIVWLSWDNCLRATESLEVCISVHVTGLDHGLNWSSPHNQEGQTHSCVTLPQRPVHTTVRKIIENIFCGENDKMIRDNSADGNLDLIWTEVSCKLDWFGQILTRFSVMSNGCKRVKLVLILIKLFLTVAHNPCKSPWPIHDFCLRISGTVWVLIPTVPPLQKATYADKTRPRYKDWASWKRRGSLCGRRSDVLNHPLGYISGHLIAFQRGVTSCLNETHLLQTSARV